MAGVEESVRLVGPRESHEEVRRHGLASASRCTVELSIRERLGLDDCRGVDEPPVLDKVSWIISIFNVARLFNVVAPFS